MFVVADDETKVNPMAVFPVGRSWVQATSKKGVEQETLHLGERSQFVNFFLLVLGGKISPGFGLHIP
jgi:hypothetical protein